MTAIELAERDLLKAQRNLERAEKRPNIPAAELEHHRELVRLREEILGLVSTQGKRETCRERLQREHPEKVNPICYGGCRGCPDEYSYAVAPYYCDGGETRELCKRCWDRPVEED